MVVNFVCIYREWYYERKFVKKNSLQLAPLQKVAKIKSVSFLLNNYNFINKTVRLTTLKTCQKAGNLLKDVKTSSHIHMYVYLPSTKPTHSGR